MKLSELVAQYVSHKRALGMRFDFEAATLASFCHRLGGNIDVESVTVEQVQDFLTGNRPLTNHWSKRRSVLDCLFRFALSRRYVTVSPLPRYSPKLPPPLTPYIYSQEELKRLLDVASAACSPHVPLDAYVLRALILILYGACLRHGEALRLTMQDVNLDEAVLYVRESKFFKSRLVPLGADLNGAMQRYARQRNQKFGQTPDAPFFCFRDGRPLTQTAVRRAFQRQRILANIQREGGASCQPRLHDLRHAGAVHRLISWYRCGADLQLLLPQLATYLGHIDLAGTQRYLTLTPELLNEASERFEAYALETHHE
ncbi:tyrosine-type recombinase/integrase [Paraburkholderia tagetis]|uniref:Tyrosine-type recombinase/integrase n=1 Tax=Paraburkholderia tagetis TaxID=2913261 RepID=A0A9X1UPT2_9BURK|nr:tyrosine-type recombinase/integrase [Paraburkholderia tagetis]MCG5078976.1 tyrosine-type recombinase/integrase [Paraburkholderia tagetis]